MNKATRGVSVNTFLALETGLYWNNLRFLYKYCSRQAIDQYQPQTRQRGSRLDCQFPAGLRLYTPEEQFVHLQQE